MSKVPSITPYFDKKISRRLKMYFDLATPQHIARGMSWYKEANKEVEEMHKEYKGITIWQIGGMVSALSPRNNWERNLYDTRQVLDALRHNIHPEKIKVCTFNSNKYKAFAIGAGLREITKDSRKTYSFLKNIVELDPNYVTIDVWHLRACFGKTMETGLTKKRYDDIASITIREAKKRGLFGYQYQAIIWECIRDRDEIL